MLFERRPALGGLTTSIRRHGLSFDNGQHVFLRCCTAYLELLDRLGAREQVFLQPRLDVPVLAPGGARASIRRSGLPAPLHLLGSLATVPPPVAAREGAARPAGARAAASRSGRRHARRRLVRRLADQPGPERARHRPPLGPDRAADAQRAGPGGVARARDEGVPDGPPRPVRQRGHRLGDGAPRPAARGQRRPRPRCCRCRDRARRRRGLDRPLPVGLVHDRVRSQADGRGLRRGRHAAAGGSHARCLRRRCGRAARDVPDRQRPPGARSASDRPRDGGLRRLADPVCLRQDRLERDRRRPVPRHLALGCRRLHRQRRFRARGALHPGARRCSPGGPQGHRGRRRRHPRAGGDVPGRSRRADAAPADRDRGTRAVPRRRLVRHRLAGDDGRCGAQRPRGGRAGAGPLRPRLRRSPRRAPRPLQGART